MKMSMKRLMMVIRESLETSRGHSATIVQGPHRLFMGMGGKPTFGITVRALPGYSSPGHKDEWDINDHDILSRSDLTEFLGLTPEEHTALVSEIERLVDGF